MNEGSIPLPITTVVDGRTWRLFDVLYSTADGEFSTYIYALSFEHAELLIEELRQTARLGGQIQGWVKA